MEQLQARIRFLETELNEALSRHEEAVSHQHYLEEKLDRVTEQRDAARADYAEAAEIRDRIGYLGTVAQCLEWLAEEHGAGSQTSASASEVAP